MFYRVTRFLVVLSDNVNLPTQTAQYNYNTNIDLQHDGSHAMDNSQEVSLVRVLYFVET